MIIRIIILLFYVFVVSFAIRLVFLLLCFLNKIILQLCRQTKHLENYGRKAFDGSSKPVCAFTKMSINVRWTLAYLGGGWRSLALNEQQGPTRSD